MHTDQEYGENIMTSHEISDRDKATKNVHYSVLMQNNFVILFKYCILIIMHYTYSKHMYD